MGAAAYSINEFCAAYSLSRSTFYDLISQGKAPRTFRVGRKVLISQAAAEDWRRAREREAAAS